MAATALSVTANLADPTAKGAAGQTAAGGTGAAADAANGNIFANDGNQVLVVVTDANARTIIFQDKAGVAMTTVNLAASKVAVFGPFDVNLYNQTVGSTTGVAFTVNNAAVVLRVVNLSGDHLVNTRTRS